MQGNSVPYNKRQTEPDEYVPPLTRGAKKKKEYVAFVLSTLVRLHCWLMANQSD